MPDPPQKENISVDIGLPGFSAYRPGIMSGSLSSRTDGHDVRQVEAPTPYACFMTERRPYPSDLSDARWALITPRLTAWRQARTDAAVSGRTPPTTCATSSTPSSTSTAPASPGATYPTTSRPTAPSTATSPPGAKKASSPNSTTNSPASSATTTATPSHPQPPSRTARA